MLEEVHANSSDLRCYEHYLSISEKKVQAWIFLGLLFTIA